MTTSTRTSTRSGSYRRSFRNYLLDSHFQLKYAAFLMLVAIGTSGLMGAVLWTTTRAMVAESDKVVEESRKAADESKKVSSVTRMNVRDFAAESPELVAEFDRQADTYDRTISDHERTVAAQQDALIAGERRMIASLVGGLTLMVFVIGLFGIYFTHRVAGPIFKMTRLLKQVGEGNLRVEAQLRKGDELKGFFDAFTRMVVGLRGVERRRLDELEIAMDAFERGEYEEAKRILERLRRSISEAAGL